MARHCRHTLRTVLSWLIRLAIPVALALPCLWAPWLCYVCLPVAVIAGGIAIERGISEE